MSMINTRRVFDGRLAATPGILFHRDWWLGCRVKILIVSDGFGEFGTGSFGLAELLAILADDPWSHVQFAVTKAHRGVDPASDIDNFRFDTHDLAQYSQIWLFGFDRTNGPIDAAELRTLTQFMDGGGGVFATGDHENLGQAMCAEVPRVRSMRRWYYPNPGPNGEPVAPEQSGPGRHDTVMDTDPGVPGLQGSQSDGVAQPIHPTFYSRTTGGGLIRQVHTFPHPVLCGPSGVIRYLPDHMHEGLCEVPTDLGHSHTFDCYTSVEYPPVDGAPFPPEIIARATTRNTDNDEFGVLAAYDGHRAGIGRVLVDATWHHWVNINLVGFVNATTPGDPTYDPALVGPWESIKAYFRNVGVWLARPSLQSCLRNGGLLIATRYSDILITVRDLKLVPDRLTYFWQLGRFAKDALGRFASQCQSTRWIVDTLPEFDFRIDPWRVPGPKPLPEPPPWLDQTELETVALGGAIHMLHEAFGREPEAQVLLDRRGDEIGAVARKGAAMATAEWARHYQRNAKSAERLAVMVERQFEAAR